MLAALSREIRSGCSEELSYADDLALVNQTLSPERETRSLQRSNGVKRFEHKS